MRSLAVSLCALALPALAAQKGRVFPFPTQVEKLPGGLRVVLVPFESPGLAAYYTLVRVGSRNEVEKGHSGFAHFFEHMMFRGTENHPKASYDEILSKSGVSNNAFTTDDYTCYTVFGPAAALPVIVELEADRIQNLKYSVADFKTEAKAVLGEYNKNFSNPTEKMEEVLRDLAYARHTYKHTTMGFLADIEAMPQRYEYSLKFFRRFYTPDNATIIVVGDIDAGKVMALVRKHYGGWQRKSQEAKVAAEPSQPAEKRKHIEWVSPTQPRMMIAFHTPAASTASIDTAVQNVLGPYLFGPTSPLYKDLVLDRQLAQSVDFTYWDHRDPYLFTVLFTLKSDDAFGEAERAFQKAVDDLAKGTVDGPRLADIQSNLRYSTLKGFDNAERVALELASSLGPTGEIDYLNALFERIEQVDGPSLAGFASRHLLAKNRTVVALTGKAEKPEAGAPPGAAAKKEGAR